MPMECWIADMFTVAGNMQSRTVFIFCVTAIFLIASLADRAESGTDSRESREAFGRLSREYPGIHAYRTNGRVTRLYGRPFAGGSSPEATAELIRQECADVFGAKAEDLRPRSFLSDARHLQPLMYSPLNGEYKFVLAYFAQYRGDIPVFRADLRVLIKNESSYPAVLAVSALRNLGEFIPHDRLTIDFESAKSTALSKFPDLTDFTEPERVIWAGYNDLNERPRLAISFVGYNDYPERWLFVCDAVTGEILFEEDQIILEDVSGVVLGNATVDAAAEQCDEEMPRPLSYARVNIDTTEDYADVNGNYQFTGLPPSPVDVTSCVRGEYFVVYNLAGDNAQITVSATPPATVSFLHNEANTEERRAEVNAYIHANIIRDLVMAYNPSYPEISTQSDFPVRVNSSGPRCPGNAWYDQGLSAINFCISGDGHPNSALGSIVYHEYGHHIIEMSGSGQGQYGEGMSDCMAILLTDDPGLAYGLNGDCAKPLRTADNDVQYPCAFSIHYCGQLLSGCIWSIRNNLAQTLPADYLDTLANLTINSILLHTGDMITPQLTIDFLTLDDDDGDLGNGTPHNNEICSGFAEHNMHCPQLTLVRFEYPDGRPEYLLADQDTTIRVNLHPLDFQPVAGSGAVYYAIDGAPFQQGTMSQLAPNEYEIVLPPLGSGSILEWYLSADVEDYGTVTDPQYAPAATHVAFVGLEPVVAFEDDFETDKGWTVFQGLWERGHPTGGGGEHGYPDPVGGHSGENVLGYNLDGDYEAMLNYDNVISPPIDCGNLIGARLKFWRWLGVEDPLFDDAYILVSNDNADWKTIWFNETEITDSSWQQVEYDISAIADMQPTVWVRFIMGPTDASWEYCGWNIDDLQVSAIVSYLSSFLCGDGNGSGAVDIDDAVHLINHIFAGGPAPDPPEAGDVDCSGGIDIDDVVYLIAYIFSGGSAPCDINGDEVPDC